MIFRVTFMGTGPSMGVPVIGCDCGVCLSANPRNRRLRASIRVDSEACPDSEVGEGTLVVDAGPDFRQQALASGLKRLDAVVFTHAHADHILGLDEVRIFNFRTRRAMPLYGTEETFRHIKKVFHYAFDPDNAYAWKPKFDMRAFIPGEPFRAAGLELLPVRFGHGGSEVIGFRMGPFVYCTDVRDIPEEAYASLQGADTMVLNALRYEKHPTHMCLDEALAALRRIGARRSFLTHMGHEFDYDELSKALPPGVFMAHDGMTLEF